MSRNNNAKWARRAVLGTLFGVATIGCNPLNIIGFLGGRNEKAPAQYPLAFGKDSPKKDKDEVVVALLPHLAPGTAREFVTADRELADKLARMLPEMAKENKEKDRRKLRVISPTQVDKFKVANPTWNRMNAGEIGEKLGADFVLEIELKNMRLYQPASLNNIYEGRGEINVSIYEVGGTDGGAMKDSYLVSFAYPKVGVRDTSTMPAAEFKKLYLENLASEIARMHVDTRVSLGIADEK